MTAPARSRRMGPALLMGGASILLYRTIALLARGARAVLRSWVVVLTVVEMIVDAVTLVAAARWWRSGNTRDARLPLRTGAAATVLHAARVLVFVLGRTGPWKDFDVRPEQRADHRQRWTWRGVVFAGLMSCLGVLGMLIIWRARRTRLPVSAPVRRRAGGRAR